MAQSAVGGRGWRPVTDRTTQRAIECPEPDPAPGHPGRREPQPVDPPSIPSDSVELDRLIARAQLTLAQAVELGAGVVAEARRRSGLDAGEPGHEPVIAGPLLIGADGRIVPLPCPDGRPDRGPAAAGALVGEVLAGIADAVRSRARAAGPAAEQLLAELDRAVAELSVAGVPGAARTLQEAAGAIDRRAVRAEIGALVRAIGADVRPAGGIEPTGAWPASARASPAWRTGTGRTSTARRQIGAWLLSLVVLAGVVVLEIAFLRGHIVADVGQLLKAGRGGPTSSPSAARTPDGVPVIEPAPASAGRVAGVDRRAFSPCAPGSPCTVRIAVRLTPGTGRQIVTWTYRIVDRCTGTSVEAPGGSVALPPGEQQAAAVATVPLPTMPGVALIAVTDKPAAAASPPVVVGSCPSRP